MKKKVITRKSAINLLINQKMIGMSKEEKESHLVDCGQFADGESYDVSFVTVLMDELRDDYRGVTNGFLAYELDNKIDVIGDYQKLNICPCCSHYSLRT
ncbi:MAG: hypothetical protein MK212_18350, partial [Saprospiraceae bacterium]|nr:hypothetical protein [Saprospiraceae bacterium]